MCSKPFSIGALRMAKVRLHLGVTERILTNPVDGLDGYEELMRLLVEEKSALKVYLNVADE